MNDLVTQTITELERFMKTVDDALAIPREAGEFIHALILAGGAKHAVEIGTSYGYSGLWIASAVGVNGGRLITIDRAPHKTEAARANFKSAGLLDLVDLRTGAAADVLSSIEGSVDFVLNDADKENCRRYVELLADKLSDRAIVLTDNTLSHAEQMADFVAWIRTHGGFCSVHLPIGNGMEMSVRCGTR